VTLYSRSASVSRQQLSSTTQRGMPTTSLRDSVLARLRADHQSTALIVWP